VRLGLPKDDDATSGGVLVYSPRWLLPSSHFASKIEIGGLSLEWESYEVRIRRGCEHTRPNIEY
jgi:hypothetical protein